jgi:simple sugar transport system permease protein
MNSIKNKVFLKKLPLRIVRSPESGAFLAFLVLFIFFSVFAEKFFTIKNIASIFTVVSELGIVSIGITFLMISGEFDLSIGSVFAFTIVVFGISLNAGIPLFLALLISLACGAFTGFINGIITIKAKIPSFIVTLGMMMWWRGVVLFLSRGDIYFKYAGNPNALRILNQPIFKYFRTSFIWFLCLIIIFQIILTRTKYGNSVFAVGGNIESARALGINVDRIKLTSFIIVGVLTALAGCLFFARFQTLDPQTGKGMELEAITACVIGGTMLAGGYGSTIGTFIGVFITGMLSAALILLGVSAYYYQAFIGLILILAVIMNSRMRRLDEKW